jgi:hypothetical protein
MANWRVGRDLKSEARTAKLRQELQTWQSQPDKLRRPQTKAAWAREHGISTRMVFYLLNTDGIRRPHARPKLTGKLGHDHRLQHAIDALIPDSRPVLKSPVSQEPLTPQTPKTVPIDPLASTDALDRYTHPELIVEGHTYNCICPACKIHLMLVGLKLKASQSLK